VRTTVIEPAELTETDCTTWRSFQQAQPGLRSPFLTPEFAAAAGRVRPNTRVAILEDAGEITGFFPFERRPLGYGVPAAPGLNCCQGLVHAPDAVWNANDLLHSCKLAVWEFDHLVDGQKPFERYQMLRAAAPVIDLDSDADALLAALRRRSSRVAKKLPKLQRRLERDFGPLRCELKTGDHSDLRTLMAWKSEQYRRTGRTDRFAAAWARRLVADLFEMQAPYFSLVLSVLYAGEHPIAIDLYLRRDGVLSGWFTAYDPRFAKYSPGLLQRLNMIEPAAASGVRLIELGRGAYEYKDLFKTRDVVMGEGRVLRPSAAAALYYTGRAPVRRLRQSVMDSPTLYRGADKVLRHYGRLRSGLGGQGHAADYERAR
jgi:CelD/BcsL family acetyltransferase involved in cellulose biosynthesis